MFKCEHIITPRSLNHIHNDIQSYNALTQVAVGFWTPLYQLESISE